MHMMKTRPRRNGARRPRAAAVPSGTATTTEMSPMMRLWNSATRDTPLEKSDP